MAKVRQTIYGETVLWEMLKKVCDEENKSKINKLSFNQFLTDVLEAKVVSHKNKLRIKQIEEVHA